MNIRRGCHISAFGGEAEGLLCLLVDAYRFVKLGLVVESPSIDGYVQ
jgi:hypothetical protein